MVARAPIFAAGQDGRAADQDPSDSATWLRCLAALGDAPGWPSESGARVEVEHG